MLFNILRQPKLPNVIKRGQLYFIQQCWFIQHVSLVWTDFLTDDPTDIHTYHWKTIFGLVVNSNIFDYNTAVTLYMFLLKPRAYSLCHGQKAGIYSRFRDWVINGVENNIYIFIYIYIYTYSCLSVAVNIIMLLPRNVFFFVL